MVATADGVSHEISKTPSRAVFGTADQYHDVCLVAPQDSFLSPPQCMGPYPNNAVAISAARPFFTVSVEEIHASLGPIHFAIALAEYSFSPNIALQPAH